MGRSSVIGGAAGREAVVLRGTAGVAEEIELAEACVADADGFAVGYETGDGVKEENPGEGAESAGEAVREENGAVTCVEDGGTGVLGAERTGTAAGAGTRVAPHIPQKRFDAGLSLPQRGQRTDPPEDSAE